MKQKSWKVEYEEYASADEMAAEDRELVHEAIEAMKGAYAPFSGFHVGAAVRLTNGVIVRGANQENAAFPSGLCAERTAMFSAGASYRNEDIRSIAIAGGPEGRLADEPVTPCGACRQVMAQYQAKAGKPLSVIMTGGRRIWKFACVDDIMPLIFDMTPKE